MESRAIDPVSAAGRRMPFVARVEELEDGKLKLIKIGKTPLALVKIADRLHCVSAICTHTRIFLAPGRLTPDGLIECPMHGALFSPQDGSVRCAPATEPLRVHELVVIDGAIHVDPGEEESEQQKATTTPGARPSAAQWGNWA